MRPAAFAAALIALPALAACGQLREAVNGPKMGPMAYPSVLVGQEQPVLGSAREPLPQPASANSLWRTGARAFFIDRRAARVGDILTVLITIDDSAKTSNSTNTARTTANKTGIPHFFGLESTLGKILPKAYDPTNMIETNNEVRQLTVAGIVRPEDISSSNTIKHTQIAEARISYGGRGDVSVVQKTPAGTSLLQRFEPF